MVHPNSAPRNKRSGQTDGVEATGVVMSMVHRGQPANTTPPVRASSRQDSGWWGLLPQLHWQGRAIWLPLSDTAMVALLRALHSEPVATLATEQHQASVAEIGLLQALRCDPPLLFYALLSFACELDEQDEIDLVCLTDLASHLHQSIIPAFSAGEWMLAAPQYGPTQQRHWSRLLAQSPSLEQVDGKLGPEASASLSIADLGEDPQQEALSQWREQLPEWVAVLNPDVEAADFNTLPEVYFDAELDTATRSDLADPPGSALLQRAARFADQRRASQLSIDQLANQKKLQAAQQLAYGLSHEINNPLANISARAQALQREETDADRLESLKQIDRQVYRAFDMIAGLMFYANPPAPEVSAVKLSELFAAVRAEFSEFATSSQIDFQVIDSGEACLVQADREMLLEAIRVLVRNAFEAVGQGGAVHVRATPTRLATVGNDELAAVEIRVADSGPGLDAAASRHAFDPFYSGREAGRGLGLGLCRAHRVAQLHNATVEISSGLAGCQARLIIPLLASS